MISMDKKYRTRDGRDVRVLCVDRENISHPVVALIGSSIESYTIDGEFHFLEVDSNYDLIEVSPYDHIKKGDVVLVWDNVNQDIKLIAFFVGVGSNGRIHATAFFNSESYNAWDNCELYTGNK